MSHHPINSKPAQGKTAGFFLGTLLITGVLFVWISCLSAETIELKQGTVIEGTVTEWRKDGLSVRSSAGIDLTYYFDEILTIDGEAVTTAPEPVVIRELSPQEIKEINQSAAGTEIEQRVPKGPVENDISPMEFPSAYDERKFQNEISSPTPQNNFFAFKNRVKRSLMRSMERFQAMRKDDPYLLFYLLSFLLAGWPLTAIPLYLIARKFDDPNRAWACFPLLNVFLITRLADKSLILAVLCLIPGASVIFMPLMWAEISGFLRRGKFLGFLTILPGMIWLLPWYYALDKKAQYFGRDIERRQGYNPDFQGTDRRKPR